MSVKNELSSEIAVALLARGGQDPERLKYLREVVLRIHSTLQQINERSDHKREQEPVGERDNRSRARDAFWPT